MIELLGYDTLKTTKNLLAFSGGVDSSALFFLLLKHNISFDMAFVNYHTRPESCLEQDYALTLAEQYQKRIFIHSSPCIVYNFEHEARRVRYKFFEQIIQKEGYESLILAHQLNDRLEWLLMSVLRGGGLSSLIGANFLEKRGLKTSYFLVRPLLHTPKSVLYSFLQDNNHHFFEDESNNDKKYKRNQIRQILPQSLIDAHVKPIVQSFQILQEECRVLYPFTFHIQEELIFFLMDGDLQNLQAITKACKILGYVPSLKQREEILKQSFEGVIGGEIAVGIFRNHILVSPFKKYHIQHSLREHRKFKERMRTLKIPLHIRPYLSHFPHLLNSLDTISLD